MEIMILACIGMYLKHSMQQGNKLPEFSLMGFSNFKND